MAFFTHCTELKNSFTPKTLEYLFSLEKKDYDCNNIERDNKKDKIEHVFNIEITENDYDKEEILEILQKILNDFRITDGTCDHYFSLLETFSRIRKYDNVIKIGAKSYNYVTKKEDGTIDYKPFIYSQFMNKEEYNNGIFIKSDGVNERCKINFDLAYLYNSKYNYYYSINNVKFTTESGKVFNNNEVMHICNDCNNKFPYSYNIFFENNKVVLSTLFKDAIKIKNDVIINILNTRITLNIETGRNYIFPIINKTTNRKTNTIKGVRCLNIKSVIYGGNIYDTFPELSIDNVKKIGKYIQYIVGDKCIDFETYYNDFNEYIKKEKFFILNGQEYNIEALKVLMAYNNNPYISYKEQAFFYEALIRAKNINETYKCSFADAFTKLSIPYIKKIRNPNSYIELKEKLIKSNKVNNFSDLINNIEQSHEYIQAITAIKFLNENCPKEYLEENKDMFEDEYLRISCILNNEGFKILQNKYPKDILLKAIRKYYYSGKIKGESASTIFGELNNALNQYKIINENFNIKFLKDEENFSYNYFVKKIFEKNYLFGNAKYKIKYNVDNKIKSFNKNKINIKPLDEEEFSKSIQDYRIKNKYNCHYLITLNDKTKKYGCNYIQLNNFINKRLKDEYLNTEELKELEDYLNECENNCSKEVYILHDNKEINLKDYIVEI